MYVHVCMSGSQAFLHSHNRPQLSLHEEMVRREREREREERRRQQAEMEANRLREEERVRLKQPLKFNNNRERNVIL